MTLVMAKKTHLTLAGFHSKNTLLVNLQKKSFSTIFSLPINNKLTLKFTNFYQVKKLWI